jgi:hypothetical protein
VLQRLEALRHRGSATATTSAATATATTSRAWNVMVSPMMVPAEIAGMPAPTVTFPVTVVAVIVKFMTIIVAAVPAGAAAGASIEPVHLLAVWA